MTMSAPPTLISFMRQRKSVISSYLDEGRCEELLQHSVVDGFHIHQRSRVRAWRYSTSLMTPMRYRVPMTSLCVKSLVSKTSKHFGYVVTQDDDAKEYLWIPLPGWSFCCISFAFSSSKISAGYHLCRGIVYAFILGSARIPFPLTLFCALHSSHIKPSRSRLYFLYIVCVITFAFMVLSWRHCIRVRLVSTL